VFLVASFSFQAFKDRLDNLKPEAKNTRIMRYCYQRSCSASSRSSLVEDFTIPLARRMKDW